MKKLFLWMMCGCLAGALPVIAAAQTPRPEAAPSLEERVQKLEETVQSSPRKEAGIPPWFDRIHLSGLIEVEAGYGQIDFDDPAQEDETSSDVDLATVELGLDIDVVQHVSGHVLIKWEEDDLFVDEGYITLDGGDKFPAYLIAGRQYIPFGTYESHFITDPNTLLLGETNEGAVVAGYRIGKELVDLSVGVYNGAAQKGGDDDTVDSWVAAVTVHPIENVTLGLSYTSNLASAAGLNDVCMDPENLDSLVDGAGAFAQIGFLERFTLTGEYIAALDRFRAGELYDSGDPYERRPSAWNVEIAAAITDTIELAARYGGSEDGADFLPEAQFGAVASWQCFKYTTLALEYLHADDEEDVQTTHTVTAQLAVAF